MTKKYISASADPDVVLIGAGIMSATLGVMLKQLQPDLTIEVFERLDIVEYDNAEDCENCQTNFEISHSAGNLEFVNEFLQNGHGS